MSKVFKWVIAVVVIVVLGLLVWRSGWLTSVKPGMQTNTQGTKAPAAPTNGMSASNDASDAALVQDSAAIDSQMQGYSADSAAVDSGLGDKSVGQ
ncbi:MAG: hypothetical protein WCK46_01935 [Candidatus Adlerbacteria bacterium]